MQKWGVLKPKVQKFPTILSDLEAFRLQDVARSRRTTAFFTPFVFAFFSSSYLATARIIETDRSGDRFKEYWTRAHYAGLEEQAAVALAQDVVMRTDTIEDGRRMLDLAMSNLVKMGIVQAPKYTPEGLIEFPEHILEEIRKRDATEGRDALKIVPTLALSSTSSTTNGSSSIPLTPPPQNKEQRPLGLHLSGGQVVASHKSQV
jgi:hypothetical protein